MKIETYKINNKKLSLEKPFFVDYKFNFNQIKSLSKYKFDNLIVIGYGGSINSFKAIYYANMFKAKKNVFFIDTVEPDYLNYVVSKCKKNNSLIVAISKSGNTISLLEDVLFFMNKGFKNFIFITSGGALKELGVKVGAKLINHPNIGGRFAGLTECALIPSALAGINIKKVVKGAKKVYFDSELNKRIAGLAEQFFKLELKSYTEIFSPSYSENLYGINLLATQLVHETTGKKGIGQTILTAVSPESQHETNQRFFGGRKNMIGLFTTFENHKNVLLKVPKLLKDVKVKGEKLSVLDKLNLSDSLNFEAEGVIRTARKFKIPFANIVLDRLNEESTGELMAFWQLFSVYSAVVRKQNPYDQPEVEHSKNETLKLISSRNKKK